MSTTKLELPQNAAELAFLCTATSARPTLAARSAVLAAVHRRGATLPMRGVTSAESHAWAQHLAASASTPAAPRQAPRGSAMPKPAPVWRLPPVAGPTPYRWKALENSVAEQLERAVGGWTRESKGATTSTELESLGRIWTKRQADALAQWTRTTRSGPPGRLQDPVDLLNFKILMAVADARNRERERRLSGDE